MKSVHDLKQAILEKDKARIEQFFASLKPLEAAQMVAQIPKREQKLLFTLLNVEQAAHVVEAMQSSERSTIIDEMAKEKASGIIGAMESNEGADLLLELSQNKREQLIELMQPADAEEARELISYPENSAGGLMAKEFIAFEKSFKVSDVLKYLRDHAATFDQYSVSYVYVLDKAKQLVGVLRLRDLILKNSESSIEEIMITNPIAIPVKASFEEVEKMFEQHHFLALPVVSSDKKMAGIITAHNVDQSKEKNAIETLLKFTGIGGGEELRTMPIFLRVRNRLSWLSVNIGLNLISASVITFFEDTLKAAIAIAVFLPIISDMSGCSGSQAVAVSIRELTLGRITLRDYRSILTKELLVGFINGFVLGIEIGVVAFLWKGIAVLGIVVAFALWCNTLISVCVGGLLPVTLKHFKWDPAVASSPILTTVTDTCGFFITLSLTRTFLPYLIH